MAIFTTGFEVGDDSHYENDLGWTFTGTTTVVNTTVHDSLTSRGGSWALSVDDGVLTPFFGSGGRWLHFWFDGVGDTDTRTFYITFNNSGGTNQATVVLTPRGHLFLRRGGINGTFVAEGTPINPEVGHWMAIEIVCEESPNGLCNIYVDDVLHLTVTNEDLRNSAVDGWEQVHWNGTNLAMFIDDIIVTTVSEGRLDEHFARLMIPDGNDVINSEATSTGGAGDYTNVDEVPPDDGTTYNDFTVTNTDRYTTANLGYTPASIHCVTVMAKARDGDGLGTAQTVCATDSGGGGATEALGAAYTLSTAYEAWQDVFNVDPDTASAWTSTGLDDLRIGINFST